VGGGGAVTGAVGGGFLGGVGGGGGEQTPLTPQTNQPPPTKTRVGLGVFVLFFFFFLFWLFPMMPHKVKARIFFWCCYLYQPSPFPSPWIVDPPMVFFLCGPFPLRSSSHMLFFGVSLLVKTLPKKELLPRIAFFPSPLFPVM